MELDRMNKILELDEDNLYAVVQTGVRTSEIQEQCRQRGFCMPEIRVVPTAAKSAVRGNQCGR